MPSRAELTPARPLHGILALLLLVVVRALSAAVPTIAPAELRPGMRGYGLSVFSGTKIDRFEAEVVDVMFDLQPGRDMILCRLSGMNLEETGVVAGMSGSPVYFDGRLAGAMAYGWSFAKEPLAGITPIGEMLGVWDLPAGRSGPRTSPPGAPGGLRRIAVPAALTGYTEKLARLVEPELAPYGLVPTAAGRAAPGSAGAVLDSLIAPGAAIGVALVDGDVRFSIIGTVTHRESTRVLAFGHPMFQAGGIEMPFCAGTIHGVMSSYAESFKLFSSGDLVGTMTQDRLPGVGGFVGPLPRMVPVTARIRTPSVDTVYHYRLIDHLPLVGLLSAVGLAGIIYSTEGLLEKATLYSTMRVFLPDASPQADPGRPVTTVVIRHAQAGLDPASRLFRTVIGELNDLLAGDLPVPCPDSISFDVDLVAGERAAQIVSVLPDAWTVTPGETLVLTVKLQRRDDLVPGAERNRAATDLSPESQQLRLPIPAALPEGRLKIVVCSRDSLFLREAGRVPGLTEPESFRDLLAVLDRLGGENILAVAGYLSQPGMVVGGNELPAPPPSVRRVIGRSAGTRRLAPTLESRVFENTVPLAEVLSGTHEFEVEVLR